MKGINLEHITEEVKALRNTTVIRHTQVTESAISIDLLWTSVSLTICYFLRNIQFVPSKNLIGENRKEKVSGYHTQVYEVEGIQVKVVERRAQYTLL